MPSNTDRHTRAALRHGYTLADAERAAKWVAERVPRGTDPATWTPDANTIGGGVFSQPLTRDMEHDALVAWFADDAVADKWKRVLSARERGDE